MQAGHEIILQCECDPGAQQVRMLETICRCAARADLCWVEMGVRAHQLPVKRAPCNLMILTFMFDLDAPQVLRKAFPGVLLVPDICGLDRLPKVTDCFVPIILLRF